MIIDTAEFAAIVEAADKLAADPGPDAARLAELVYDQGDAIAALTARLSGLMAYIQRECEAAGMRGPEPVPARPRGHLRVIQGGRR